MLFLLISLLSSRNAFTVKQFDYLKIFTPS
jgi:hypothetical protein